MKRQPPVLISRCRAHQGGETTLPPDQGTLAFLPFRAAPSRTRERKKPIATEEHGQKKRANGHYITQLTVPVPRTAETCVLVKTCCVSMRGCGFCACAGTNEILQKSWEYRANDTQLTEDRDRRRGREKQNTHNGGESFPRTQRVVIRYLMGSTSAKGTHVAQHSSG